MASTSRSANRASTNRKRPPNESPMQNEGIEKRPSKRKRNQLPLCSVYPSSPLSAGINAPHKMTSQRSVPAFLHKLYNMVGDPNTNQLVRWSKDGNSFLVEGHEEFARLVLPRFYKHNTFASFVRQLNMYDFHKVPHLQQGVLVNDSSAQNEVWEFSHPHFQRNRSDLLVLVTRKRNRDRDKTDADQFDLGSLVKEISAIRKHQANVTADLRNLHQDNELIWQETLSAREKHQKHQRVISKILQFLSAVFSNDQHKLRELNHQREALENQGNLDQTIQCQENKKPHKFVSSNHNYHSNHHHRHYHNRSNVDSGVSSNSDTGVTNGSDSGLASSSDNSGNNSSEDDTKAPLLQPPPLPPNPKQLHAKMPEYTSAKSLKSDKFAPSVAARSAQAITSDIDELQENVELLAAQLGIDPSQFSEKFTDVKKFSDDHGNLISSASRDDKLRLFEMANEDNGNRSTSKHADNEHLLQHMPSEPYLPSEFLMQSDYDLVPATHFFQHLLKRPTPTMTVDNNAVPEKPDIPDTNEYSINHTNNNIYLSPSHHHHQPQHQHHHQAPLHPSNPLPIHQTHLSTGTLPPNFQSSSDVANHLFAPSYRQRNMFTNDVLNPDYYRPIRDRPVANPYYEPTMTPPSAPPPSQPPSSFVHQDDSFPSSGFNPIMYTPNPHASSSHSVLLNNEGNTKIEDMDKKDDRPIIY
ncbi:uncharacterized protein B0P05DRAFT_542987 [Gilbertella persicaria]|uniref:uncharacterized protein n=1 Tax=Gilbertella persicaria TaxID=101096 RepID=UPI002220FF15|nr:uncharacterized protein B0P05DRAFT_542987 [Gilbertella persicaria]KAI8078223.1 hypothetical protein B0P05DRAFT_542987 [Gilbertella persicaria]